MSESEDNRFMNLLSKLMKEFLMFIISNISDTRHIHREPEVALYSLSGPFYRKESEPLKVFAEAR